MVLFLFIRNRTIIGENAKGNFATYSPRKVVRHSTTAIENFIARPLERGLFTSLLNRLIVL